VLLAVNSKVKEVPHERAPELALNYYAVRRRLQNEHFNLSLEGT